MIRINSRNKNGFTLIELLVVIAIIGLISTLAIYSINLARLKARDAKRLADMTQIQKALDLYYDKNGTYPEEVSAGNGWEYSYEDNGDFIGALITGGFMGKVPVDPINNTTAQYYAYYHYSADELNYCPGKGPYYVLGVKDMESSAGAYPTNPGWVCVNRNWTTNMPLDWVTGRFEK